MGNLLQDLRYGIRVLTNNPRFALITILALGIGIGATSAVFSVINALLLKPLPFSNLERIVAVREFLPQQSSEEAPVFPADFAEWRSRAKSFRSMAAYSIRDITLTGGEP